MDDGVIGLVGVLESRMVVAGMVEDLEGKVEVLLGGDDGDEAFGVEFLRPRFDWGSNGVGFKELGFGFDGREVVVRRVGGKGVLGGISGVVACVAMAVMDFRSCL